jgi:acetyl esterase/lipase
VSALCRALILLAAFFAFSRFAPSADYQVLANIRYSSYPETILDILQSRAPALKNRPGVLMIHGPDWSSGQKEDMVEKFCVPFIEHDFVVANIDYRLAKTSPGPAAVSDVLEAAAWFYKHAAELKVDPYEIIAVGTSAGGHLALMTAMTPSAAGFGPTTRIAAVVDFYGIADVVDQLEGPRKQPYAQAWLPFENKMDMARRLSPMTYVRRGLPPVLAIHGDADTTVPYEQSVDLIKALKSAGDDAELITVAGAQHGIDAAQLEKLWPQIFKWLKKRKIPNQ